MTVFHLVAFWLERGDTTAHYCEPPSAHRLRYHHKRLHQESPTIAPYADDVQKHVIINVIQAWGHVITLWSHAAVLCLPPGARTSYHWSVYNAPTEERGKEENRVGNIEYIIPQWLVISLFYLILNIKLLIFGIRILN